MPAPLLLPLPLVERRSLPGDLDVLWDRGLPVTDDESVLPATVVDAVDVVESTTFMILFLWSDIYFNSRGCMY